MLLRMALTAGARMVGPCMFFSLIPVPRQGPKGELGESETENMAQSWAAEYTSCSASKSGSRQIYKQENKVKIYRVYFRSMCLEGKRNEQSGFYFQGNRLERGTGMMSGGRCTS